MAVREISLLVKIGDEEHSTPAWMNFMVLRLPSPYNGIIGRLGVRRIRAVPSTAHKMLKLPMIGGMVTLRSSRIIPLECTMVSGPGVPQPIINQVTEEKIQVAIHQEYPEQTVAIGSTLTQKKRGQASERNKAIYEEVEKLVDAGIMKEVHYHSWLSNPVMVKKHDDSWRMCVDFKDLNKACLKDGYPLPEIDCKVESLYGYLFKCFLEINMKLNPKKYAFGMREGTFLGYKVDADGLRVCPDKVEAVLNLPSPKCLKDVQKLNGKLASLNRFLSKSAEKSLPFFKTLKKCTKKSDFQCTAEAEMAFKQMKRLTVELPKLAAPKEKEELIMYLAAAKEAISVVLTTERDGKQMPIYFVSRALQGPKINYTPMEKLILALILANFIVERQKDDPLDTSMEDKEELPDPWIFFTDGSSCIDGSRTGLIITNPKGMKFTYALRFRFNATNNGAEYEALIASLWITEQIGVKNLQANVDSKLVANHVNGVYVDKEPGMIKYLEKVKNLTSTFKEFFIKQVPRGENKKVDALSKMASTSFTHLSKQILVEELKEKSINEKEVPAAKYVLREIHEGSCSMHASPRSVVAKALRSGYYWPTMHTDARSLIRECSSFQSSNGETPFSLTYGTEAVIPVEIGMPTMRTAEVDMIKNDEAMEINLDLLEEKREHVAIQEAKNKAKMEKYYNAKVSSISFCPGDLVYRNNEASRAKDGGKL
ncbi:reverse transcriptase domain-containing protein [Tanacetum coccineum]